MRLDWQASRPWESPCLHSGARIRGMGNLAFTWELAFSIQVLKFEKQAVCWLGHLLRPENVQVYAPPYCQNKYVHMCVCITSIYPLIIL